MRAAPRLQTAIILVTDLVDSTRQRTVLGEDATEALLHTHDRLLGEAIGAAQGTVVKHLGDGMLATFASAADALAAAVAMQQTVEVHNRRARQAERLAVRIGISAGDVTFQHGDCFGAAVVEAVRLCAAAAGGEILTADLVRRLARGRGGHVLEAVGPIEGKGLPEPVPAARVAWQPLGREALGGLPLPPEVEETSGATLAGRDAEVAVIGRLLAEVEDGHRRVLFLAGEPGIGKTRLALEAARAGDERGATILFGTCDEGAGVPYQPFIEALAYLVRHLATMNLARRLGRYAGELVRLVPEIGERVPDLPPPLQTDPETTRYRLFDAVASWLAAMAGEAPVVLVVDDLHWASKPSLLMLRHVVRATRRSRLLVIATHRDTEVDAEHPLTELLAALAREDGVVRLHLGGLDLPAVEELVGRAADAPEHSWRDLAAAVHEQTEGNPFFVSEIVRHLTETHRLARPPDGWTASRLRELVGIPESVRDVIGRRLARLAPDTRAVLRAGAVMGQEVSTRILALATNTTEQALLADLDEAVAAGLVSEIGVGSYRFAHALIRDALYRENGETRAAWLHGKFAETLEAAGADATTLAHHYTHAAGGSFSELALRYTLAAAERAEAVLACDQEVAHLRIALAMLERAGNDRRRHREVAVRLGRALRSAGDPAARQALLDVAREAAAAGDTAILVRAALYGSRGLGSTNGMLDDARLAVLETALGAGRSGDTAERAQLMASVASELAFAGPFDRRLALADEALAMARRLRDPPTELYVLRHRAFAIWAPSQLERQRADADDECRLAAALGDPTAELIGATHAMWVAMRSGDIEEVDRRFAAIDRLATDLGEPMLRWTVLINRVWRTRLAGRIDEAEHMAHEAFEIGRASGQPDALGILAMHLFELRWDQGRLAELEPLIADTTAKNPALAAYRPVHALTLCEMGRLDDARRLFAPDAADRFQAIHLDSIWLSAIALYAEVCARLGDREAAGTLIELLRPWEQQIAFNGANMNGAVARYLGMLATACEHWDDAERWHLLGRDLNARIGSPVWLARSDLEFADMLLRRGGRGDRTGARMMLGQVRAIAADIGLPAVSARAESLLAAAA